MRRLAAAIAVLAWGLWFGAIIAIVLFATRLFASGLPQPGESARILFLTFEPYQLILAAVALAATGVWWRLSRSRRIGVIFLLLLLAAIGAIVSPLVFTTRMEALRQAGLSGGPQFMKWHGLSMLTYTINAALLLIAGVLLPLAVRLPGTGPGK